jgi:hypothetical protein
VYAVGFFFALRIRPADVARGLTACRAGLFGRTRAAALPLAAMLALPAVLYGQGPSEPPATVPVRFGPIALAPTLSLTNLGWDSNVFNQRSDANPQEDMVAVVRPELRAWMRLGRGRLSGRSTVDFVYFHENRNERSIDADEEARLELPFARLMPYASARWARVRQRFGYEIDQRVRRHEDAQVAGLEVRVGPRTSFDVNARRSRLKFANQPSFNDPFIAEFYDYTSHGAAITARQRLTPLTSLTVTADVHRDYFDLHPERDTNSFRVSTGVEFKPFALISGRAYAGWQRVELVTAGSPPFTGAVAAADLAYTLLGATRFSVQATRDISYSAIQGQHAYLLSGATASVSHRFGGRWDIGARAGRYRLSYGVFAPLGDGSGVVPVVSNDRETVTEYGGDIGFWLGSDTRMAVNVSRSNRGSTVADRREYERTQAGMSLEYRF